MKKTIAVLSVICLLSILSLVHSQNPGMGGPRGAGGMMDSSGHARMMGKHMMGGMMMPTMVPSSDGGAILLMGNRLYKYDRNLALTKQTEVQIDTASMRQWMDMMRGAKGR